MSNSGIGQFIPLILIFVIFYFFLIRPQQKKAKEHKTMVENLKRGDKVITAGGIVGTIERIIDAEKVEVSIYASLLYDTRRRFSKESVKNGPGDFDIFETLLPQSQVMDQPFIIG